MRLGITSNAAAVGRFWGPNRGPLRTEEGGDDHGCSRPASFDFDGGENPFIRLSDKDGDPNSTDASYWRILFCPAGPGHVLYLKSELTARPLAHLLRQHRHGALAAADRAGHAECRAQGPVDPGDRRRVLASRATRATSGPSTSGRTTTSIALTWYDIGEPLLIHTEPNQPPNPRPYGVCTVLVPALGARLTRQRRRRRAGKPWPREREGPALQHLARWRSPRAGPSRAEYQSLPPRLTGEVARGAGGESPSGGACKFQI